MRVVPKSRIDDSFSPRGSLRSTPFALLLVTLLDHRKTGTLRLLDAQGTAHALVRFQAGLPLGARTTNCGSTLLQCLIPLCACADGEYVFIADQDDVGLAEGAVIGRVDPVALINAAMRGPLREDNVQDVLDAIGEREVRLHPRANLERYKFTAPEREVVSWLEEGPTTLPALLAHPNANARLVRRIAYVLKITRALSFVPGSRQVSGTIERVVPPSTPSAAPPALSGRYHVRYAEGGPTDVVPRQSAESIAPAAQSRHERQATAETQRREAERLLRRSEYPAALHAAHQALRADGSAGNEALYGWLLYLSGGDPNRIHPRAFRHLERAVQRDPECIDAHYYLGVLLKRIGNDEEAITHLRKVLRLRPDHQDAARELRLWEMRRKSSQSTPGFISRLFGKSER
jgi:tetratricopeptide (TPR) repeat protein